MSKALTSFLAGAVGATLYANYTLRTDIYDTSRTIQSSITSTNDYVKEIVKENEEAIARVSKLETHVHSLLEDKQALEVQLKRQARKLNEQSKKIQTISEEYQQQLHRIHRILQLQTEGEEQPQQQQHDE